MFNFCEIHQRYMRCGITSYIDIYIGKMRELNVKQYISESSYNGECSNWKQKNKDGCDYILIYWGALEITGEWVHRKQQCKLHIFRLPIPFTT